MNANYSLRPAPSPPCGSVRYGAECHTEIEFKFLASSAVIRQIFDSAFLKPLSTGPRRVQSLVSTYYDTRALWFAGNGLSLRVRWDGEKWVQGLKARIEKRDGFFRRHEWEMQIPSPHPVAVGVAGKAAGITISPEIIAAAEPLFETRFKRVNIAIEVQNPEEPNGDPTRIAMALDEGAIIAGQRTETISEVELELVSGPIEALAALAQRLSDSFDLRPGHLSKGKRGYRLAERTLPHASFGGLLNLSPSIVPGT